MYVYCNSPHSLPLCSECSYSSCCFLFVDIMVAGGVWERWLGPAEGYNLAVSGHLLQTLNESNPYFPNQESTASQQATYRACKGRHSFPCHFHPSLPFSLLTFYLSAYSDDLMLPPCKALRCWPSLSPRKDQKLVCNGWRRRRQFPVPLDTDRLVLTHPWREQELDCYYQCIAQMLSSMAMAVQSTGMPYLTLTKEREPYTVAHAVATSNTTHDGSDPSLSLETVRASLMAPCTKKTADHHY